MKHLIVKTACAVVLVLPAIAIAQRPAPASYKANAPQASESPKTETYAMLLAGLMMMITIASRRRKH